MKQFCRLSAGKALFNRFRKAGGVVLHYSLFTMLGLAVERLLVHPLIKWQIGTAAFGDLGLALSFSTILMMAASSGQTSTIFRFHSWRSPAERSLLFSTGFVITLLVGMALAAALLAATFIRPEFFVNETVVVFVRYLAPLVVFGALVSYLSSVLRSSMKIVLAAMLGNLVPVLSISALLLIALLGQRGAAAGLSLGAALTAIITIAVASRLRLVTSWRGWSSKEARVFAHHAPMFAIASVSASIMIMLGRWFLAYFGHSSESVAYYWIAANFSMLMTVPLGMVSSALVPMICAREKMADFSRATIRIYYLAALALPAVVFVGGWFIARPLMILYGRDTLAASSDLIFYLLIGQALYVLMIVNWGFLQKFQPAWTVLAIHLAGLALCIALSFLLVPQYGPQGAACATAAGLCLKGLVSLVLMTRLFFQAPGNGGQAGAP